MSSKYAQNEANNNSTIHWILQLILISLPHHQWRDAILYNSTRQKSHCYKIPTIFTFDFSRKKRKSQKRQCRDVILYNSTRQKTTVTKIPTIFFLLWFFSQKTGKSPYSKDAMVSFTGHFISWTTLGITKVGFTGNWRKMATIKKLIW